MYQCLNNYFNEKDTIILCPQALALVIEDVKGYPYRELFYPALNQIESQKEEISCGYKNTIVVGSSAFSSRSWYDIIIALDSKGIKDYDYDEDFNINKHSLMTTKNADIIFENKEELIFFINKMMRIKQNNEI